MKSTSSDTTVLMPRRGFLRQLAGLPLIGGAVTLIGQPTAVAEPVTRADLLAYADWLFYERPILCREICNYDFERGRELQKLFGQASPDFHFPSDRGWREVPQPSTRAALVMSAAGFDWRAPT